LDHERRHREACAGLSKAVNCPSWIGDAWRARAPDVLYAAAWAVVLSVVLVAPVFWDDGRMVCPGPDPRPLTGDWQAAPLPADPTKRLNALFLRALDDARVATPDEVRPVWPITRDDPRLQWSTDGSRVLVASLMSQRKFDAVFPTGAEGEPSPLGSTNGQEIWVTPVPQLRDFCRGIGLAGPDLALRVNQYLGLRAEWTYPHIVEFWVHPEDLFRPCADPEIDDQACALEGGHRGARASVSRPHHAWYCPKRARSYLEKDGLPWTRLGYTYDWAEGGGEVGASEYVIADGASVELYTDVGLDAYCGAAQ
jgi:hypothetical protein